MNESHFVAIWFIGPLQNVIDRVLARSGPRALALRYGFLFISVGEVAVKGEIMPRFTHLNASNNRNGFCFTVNLVSGFLSL